MALLKGRCLDWPVINTGRNRIFDAEIVEVWAREPTGCLLCSLESVCIFRHVWLVNENHCVRDEAACCGCVPVHVFASR